MHRLSTFITLLILSTLTHTAKTEPLRPNIVSNPVVADSVTRLPLPGASVFNRHGSLIGITSARGKSPYIAPNNYPVTVRYLGYKEATVATSAPDTIFLSQTTAALPEVVIESRQHKLLHMLAYVREYSTLTTYTDTVFLFREKMVDYMLLPDRTERTDKPIKFRGWTLPRVLTSRSYYRITNSQGLDSVSHTSNHHFSWSDWIALPPAAKIPDTLIHPTNATDTLRGKYSPTEIWTKHDPNITVDVNVLADTLSRRWVPEFHGFFRNDIDFDQFRLRLTYDNPAPNLVSPLDLTGYSFHIESTGRGHSMFRFNHLNELYFVNTYAEVYMLDKEYITLKEAKKWASNKLDFSNIDIYVPREAPQLQPNILHLISRVNSIDHIGNRLAQTPDTRYISPYTHNHNFQIGHRLLAMLRQLTGITLHKSHKNLNNNWNEFRRDRTRRNSRAY